MQTSAFPVGNMPCMAPPTFTLNATPDMMGSGPVQRDKVDQKTLEKAVIKASSESGVSEIYLKELFKSPDAETQADITRLITEMESGKSEADAAKELLAAVELRFISDDDSSTLDLLGKKKSKKYRKRDFHHMSYPGNPTNRKKVYGDMADYKIDKAEEVVDLKDENKKLARKAKKEKDAAKKKGFNDQIKANDEKIDKILTDHPDIKDVFADEKYSEALRRDLNKIRKERRANKKGVGFMDKREYKKASTEKQGHIIEYLNSKMKEVPDSGGHKLYGEAADSFVKMRDLAKAEGVTLKIKDADRDLARAIRAAAGGNPKAVGSWSVHTLGLGIDLYMNVDGGRYGTEASTTPMNDVVKKRESSAHKWMFVKGARHGWYPLQNEPWHWEYNPEGLREQMREELEEFLEAKAAEKAAAEEAAKSEAASE